MISKNNMFPELSALKLRSLLLWFIILYQVSHLASLPFEWTSRYLTMLSHNCIIKYFSRKEQLTFTEYSVQCNYSTLKNHVFHGQHSHFEQLMNTQSQLVSFLMKSSPLSNTYINKCLLYISIPSYEKDVSTFLF